MTLAFAWRDGSRVRHFDGRHAFLIPAALSGGAPAYFIIIEHEDFRGSDLLQQLFPQAEQSKLFTDSAGAPVCPGVARSSRGNPSAPASVPGQRTLAGHPSAWL